MTTNQQRAAEVIAEHTAQPGYAAPGVRVERAHSAARALADAGLLAPDLPEPRETPYGVTFEEGDSYYGADVRVYEKGDNAVHAYAAADYGTNLIAMRPDEARKMAAALLAAAEYAEGVAG